MDERRIYSIDVVIDALQKHITPDRLLGNIRKMLIGISEVREGDTVSATFHYKISSGDNGEPIISPTSKTTYDHIAKPA